MTKFFKGLYTAQITPFKNDKLDLESFRNMILKQIEAKVDGIVVAGSTGEVSTLEKSEYETLLNEARSLIGKDIQLIAGISANTPPRALPYVEIAEKVGVDGLMCVTPYYNRPPQRGLIKYFETIHNESALPIMVYNIPARTGVDYQDDTIIELAQLPRILGFKDSSNDFERPLRLYGKLPENFSMLSGDDAPSLGYRANGGSGLVSVISNLYPSICKEIQNHIDHNDFKSALALHHKLMPAFKAIFVDTNPIPIKYAANIMNLCSEEVRLPLARMENAQQMEAIKKALMELV